MYIRKKKFVPKEERQKRLEDIANNRIERMKRRQFLRRMATQQFYKSIRMLQANAKCGDKDEQFEDYSIFLYRQMAPDFKDRVKELELKILYPVRLVFKTNVYYCEKKKAFERSFININI